MTAARVCAVHGCVLEELPRDRLSCPRGHDCTVWLVVDDRRRVLGAGRLVVGGERGYQRPAVWLGPGLQLAQAVVTRRPGRKAAA